MGDSVSKSGQLQIRRKVMRTSRPGTRFLAAFGVALRLAGVVWQRGFLGPSARGGLARGQLFVRCQEDFEDGSVVRFVIEEEAGLALVVGHQ
eukprot:TRINITY_DN26005_c0_g1_i1.p1 TRINITY_DN26005_c0_g1~~TRINITY_DN26005_c0_g1_i1.p1  ORF type:complete len:101 (+),score=18.63 TRINITY_DN26005_c0_g1_i1:29-304(+)